MKFKIIENQWNTKKTYKHNKRPPKQKEVKSDATDKHAEEKRDEYFFKGKPFNVGREGTI